MAKNNVADLLSVGSLFTTQAERDEAQRETIRDIPLEEISDFPNHPFKVRMDASMMEMVDSVKQHGVLVPALVRPKPDGGYEMIAGHRRRKASELAEKQTLSCIVRDMTDDEATIVMVDSNLQREQILPSEKAFTYKMKLDAMRRQAGRPSKDNLRPVGADLIGTRSDELLAENSPDSARQIQRYIRLTHLIPEILDLVDMTTVTTWSWEKQTRTLWQVWNSNSMIQTCEGVFWIRYSLSLMILTRMKKSPLIWSCSWRSFRSYQTKIAPMPNWK